MNPIKLVSYSTVFLLTSGTPWAQGSSQVLVNSVLRRGRGIFSTYAHSHSLSLPGVAGDSLLFKPAGDQSTTPQAFGVPPADDVPDYRLAELFPGLTEDQLTWIEIDAFSTGNDLLSLNSMGQVDPAPAGAWAAMMFSVSATAQGRPATWIRARSSVFTGPGVGADVLSYIFAGSAGIDSSLWDRVSIEQAAGHTGHPASAELDALDIFAPLINTNEVPPSEIIFFPLSSFAYLSLTPVSVQRLIQGGAQSEVFGSGIAHGASVVRIEWDGVRWTNHMVVRTPLDLDLTNGDVDALGYDPASNAIIFSHVAEQGADPGRPQLEVSFDGLVADIMALTVNTSGDPLAPALGIQSTDDIDAFCGIDPEAHVLSRYLGTPGFVTSPFEMPLSVTRVLPELPFWDLVNIQVTGWGAIAPVDTTVDFWATANGGIDLTYLGTVDRSAEDDAVEFLQLVPPVPDPGVEIEFIAIMSDPGSDDVALSWTSRMRL